VGDDEGPTLGASVGDDEGASLALLGTTEGPTLGASVGDDEGASLAWLGTTEGANDVLGLADAVGLAESRKRLFFPDFFPLLLFLAFLASLRVGVPWPLKPPARVVVASGHFTFLGAFWLFPLTKRGRVGCSSSFKALA
jgi:hypothetical protein